MGGGFSFYRRARGKCKKMVRLPLMEACVPNPVASFVLKYSNLYHGLPILLQVCTFFLLHRFVLPSFYSPLPICEYAESREYSAFYTAI